MDAQTTGTVDFYICYQAFNVAGVMVDEDLVGFPLNPGQSKVFPFDSLLDRATVVATDISVRIVVRSDDAIVHTYYLQATLR